MTPEQFNGLINDPYFVIISVIAFVTWVAYYANSK